MGSILDLIRPTPASIQEMIMQKQLQNQQAQPVNIISQNGNENEDYLTRLQSSSEYRPAQRVSTVRQMPSFEPTSGSQMEAESRSSIDDLMAKLEAQRTQSRQQDRDQQWMSFFSKLASSKSNTLLGGLGEGAQALTDTTAKQGESNKLLDRAAIEDQIKYQEWLREQQRQEAAQQETAAYHKGELGLKAKELELGKYLPVKDAFGNVTSILDARTGKIVSTTSAPSDLGASPGIAGEPTDDPQAAAQQILDEQGTPFTPIATRQDITGRNAQAKAYNDAAIAAKKVQQELNKLDAQTGKYTPGKAINYLKYGPEAAIGQGGEGATARIEADKASKNLANAFMQSNVGSKGAGIRMVEFDAGAVPNADMTDEARSDLIKSNKAVADSQIQRNVISSLYPRMHMSNVNAIMDNYETKNPPLLPDGKANPKWMPYKDWLKSGRPNTAALALQEGDSRPKVSSGSIPPIPSSVPSGSQYSPSLKQWRDPSGKKYDVSGNPL
jgi:hypothetical protein